jgi:hypothetical protein
MECMMSESARKKREAERARADNWAKAGIGVGIGSAAIAAALLYVNHAKRKKDAPPKKPASIDSATD